MINSNPAARSLGNVELLAATREILRRGCIVEADLLVHLAEIEERRLHSEMAFPTMFAFCVDELGFSEDQAYNGEVEAPDRRDRCTTRPEATCSRLVPKAASGKAGRAGDDVTGCRAIGSASRAARRHRTAERGHFHGAVHGEQCAARQVPAGAGPAAAPLPVGGDRRDLRQGSRLADRKDGLPRVRSPGRVRPHALARSGTNRPEVPRAYP